MSETNTIAKNTIFLYFRMFLIMGVSLITSRVILDKLGVDDYGLYNVVGGVVGFLSFINGTLSVGTSRFITFAIGRNDAEELKLTFSTAFVAHLGLSLILAFLLETVGLYFVYHKLVIPDGRFDAAVIVYHISILTMVLYATQVPYTADIMAHERMGIYAYVSIFEAIGKLAICYLLVISPVDRLVSYAVLLLILQIGLIMAYRIYCIRHFEESRFSLKFKKDIFLDITKFSGWNILASFTETLKVQGVIVLMNMTFSPVIVGAQAFANQLTHVLNQFVANFRAASNPQIIKKYAAGNFEGSKELTLSTTVYVYDLVLMIGLPLFLTMPKVLDIWLVDVPEYTVFFCRWAVVNIVTVSLPTAFYVPMMASGRIKSNSLMSLIVGGFFYLLLCLVWHLGGGIVWGPVSMFAMSIIYGFIVRPLILVKEVECYSYKAIYSCLVKCLVITVCSSVIPVFVYFLLVNRDTIAGNIIAIVISIISVSVCAYVFMPPNHRRKLTTYIKNKICQTNA
ncbi:MAG: polysaccharide biosynthesis protein [Bacteroidales bacterium]|nr:polysaccharide biosynthesis protein [Candidatus Cryptobacteroides choladohippi]